MSEKAIAFKDVLKSYATVITIKNFNYMVRHLLDFELNLIFKTKMDSYELVSYLKFWAFYCDNKYEFVIH